MRQVQGPCRLVMPRAEPPPTFVTKTRDLSSEFPRTLCGSFPKKLNQTIDSRRIFPQTRGTFVAKMMSWAIMQAARLGALKPAWNHERKELMYEGQRRNDSERQGYMANGEFG